MRIIIYCFLSLILVQGCRNTSLDYDNTAVIYAFLETQINNRKFDIRIYNPPPPELKDSVSHTGNIKHDSIIHKLNPLRIYVNSMIKNDSIFKLYKEPLERYGFLKNVESNEYSMPLDIKELPVNKGVILESIESKHFFEIYESIKFNDSYGGLVSFGNLFYSDNKEKAYFEVHYFKGKLNSSTSIVYAERQNDGTWKFILDTISMS